MSSFSAKLLLRNVRLIPLAAIDSPMIGDARSRNAVGGFARLLNKVFEHRGIRRERLVIVVVKLRRFDREAGSLRSN